MTALAARAALAQLAQDGIAVPTYVIAVLVAAAQETDQ